MIENLVNPVKGLVKDITECSDEIFAEKAMGDGFLVYPCDETVVSPCDGSIKSVFPTKHAITLVSNKGTEILIHIGIDTVELEGKFFEQIVNEGYDVKCGEPLMKVNFKQIADAGYDTAVIVVVLSKNNIIKHNLDLNTNDYIQVLEIE